MIIPINTGLPTPEKPFVFVIRGSVPSLKNNRLKDFRPNPVVTKYIHHARATIKRQLPEGFVPINEPLCVGYYIQLGVYYLSDLPTSDVDNSVTTIQEAMMGALIKDDKQVAHGAFERIQLRFPEVSSTIFFWLVNSNLKEDLFKVYKYINLVEETKNHGC